MSNVFDTLQAYLGSSFVNLFNKFNQVFQVYVQADAPYRLQPEDIKNLYVRNTQGEMVPLGALLQVHRILGSELVTRYNLYPAAPIFGHGGPGFQLRPGPQPDGAGGGQHPAPGHGLRLDRHRLPGKTGGRPGLLHLRPLHHPGLHGAGRPLRKLDFARPRSSWWCPWPWWGSSWP